MSKTRLEAFSDGVIAIIITIMVFELKAPQGDDLRALLAVWPIFFAYLMSFLYLGTYWNNHHHLFQAIQRVNGRVLWANLHLLFWLSMLPFATSWMHATRFRQLPAAVYGAILLLAAVAYRILQFAMIRAQVDDSTLHQAIGTDTKGKLSIGLYILGIVLSVVGAWLSIACYATVLLIWFVPDRRIETRLAG